MALEYLAKGGDSSASISPTPTETPAQNPAIASAQSRVPRWFGRRLKLSKYRKPLGFPGRRRPSNLPLVYRQMCRLASVLLGAHCAGRAWEPLFGNHTMGHGSPASTSFVSSDPSRQICLIRFRNAGLAQAQIIRDCRILVAGGIAGRNIPGNRADCCAQVPGCVRP